jgi:hypothetical protein
MSIPVVAFTISTLRQEDGKSLKGLTPDADGWYKKLPVGIIGLPSRNSIDYEQTSAISKLRDEGELFPTKLKEGNLRGEAGHPFEIGTKQEIIQRMYVIDPKNVSHAIRQVYVDPSSDGSYYVISLDIKPCGPYGKYLDAELRDPEINTAFSLRSLTNKGTQVGNVIRRKVLTIITFDWVEGPGYKQASKRYASNEAMRVDKSVNVSLADIVSNNEACKQLGLESTRLDALYKQLGTSHVKVFGTPRVFDGKSLIEAGRKKSVFNTMFK